MKSVQAILPVFGLIAAAQAWGTGWSNETVVYETVTVNDYVTYCPEATTITHGTKTYTATAHQTLTVTGCPCTLTKTKPTAGPTAPPAEVPKPTGTGSAPNGTYIPPVWITTTVSEYTTYCPAPTSVVQGNQTYTVTQATTLTIKNCPCTVSYPSVTSTTVTLSYFTTYCPAPTTITYGTEYPVTVPVTAPGTVTVPIISVTTKPGSPPTPTAAGVTTPAAPGVSTVVGGTGAPVKPTATPSTTTPITANNADKASAGFGALVVAGIAAMLL